MDSHSIYFYFPDSLFYCNSLELNLKMVNRSFKGFRCGVKKGIQDQDSRLLNNSNLYPR